MMRIGGVKRAIQRIHSSWNKYGISTEAIWIIRAWPLRQLKNVILKAGCHYGENIRNFTTSIYPGQWQNEPGNDFSAPLSPVFCVSGTMQWRGGGVCALSFSPFDLGWERLLLPRRFICQRCSKGQTHGQTVNRICAERSKKTSRQPSLLAYAWSQLPRATIVRLDCEKKRDDWISYARKINPFAVRVPLKNFKGH